MNDENLIVGVDLNFSLDALEIWGIHGHPDLLEIFFSHLIESHKLCDVDPVKLKPT